MGWMIEHDQDLDTRGFLRFLQQESQQWRKHSFPPEHRTAPLQALGVCEEAGELAHAVLKMTQGIRGNEQEHTDAAADAVGDIIIYLSGVCTSLNIDMETAVKDAWRGVASRDWSKNKVDGVVDR